MRAFSVTSFIPFHAISFGKYLELSSKDIVTKELWLVRDSIFLGHTD